MALIQISNNTYVGQSKNMHKFTQDGWDHSQPQEIIIDQEAQSIRYRGEKGLSILQAKHHSLQPDMISGWRPKLPSCPLPLCYPNPYVDALTSHLAKDDMYSAVYIGPRYVNSVQINQKYSYFWRYRQRYSLNLAIVQQAIQRIGGDKNSIPIISSCPYKFNSAFQSGNLDLVVKVKKNQYDCFLRSDTNTKGHTNWYYFSVQNDNQIGQIKINICNMSKSRNLYSKGMKPYVKIGENGTWGQLHCTDVIFVQRYCRYGFDRKTNQLQFNYNFALPNQTVYFAYSVPYTYTDLQNFVKQMKQNYPNLVTSKRLCQSLGGVELPLLTITNKQACPQQSQNSPENSSVEPVSNIKKKAILISARIHPGESNSSHLMEGFIRQLLQDNEASNTLRAMFVFYIVPMLNPDGVIAGNFRTSYSGKDLNRQFNRLNRFLFPQITAMAQFCQHVKKSNLRGIDFYFDFHGHSAKKNLFCYGPQHPTGKSYFFKSRALAKIIQKLSPVFSYRKSIFTISQQKKNTARAYMLRNMKIPMTFTFQISNGLYQNQLKQDVYLDRKILVNTGQIILKGLYRYAQLQMKIPRKCIKAKVDTGKFKRHLNSAGASRRSDNTLKKKSLQQSSDSRLEKGKSFQKSTSLQKQKKFQDNKQFIALMKQIRQEQEEKKDQVQIEGGSDSQSQGQDLSKQQTNNLFTQIMKRNTQSSYAHTIRYKKPQKSQKMIIKKKQNEQDDIENLIREPSSNPPMPNVQSRKFRSTRMIEMSKPPIASIKNIKRGVSVEYEKVVLAQKNFTMLI